MNSHFDLGLQAFDSGQYSEAAFHFEKVWETRPRDPVLLTRLANGLKKAGRFERAVEIHAQIAEAFPQVPETWSNLAATYIKSSSSIESLPDIGLTRRL